MVEVMNDQIDVNISDIDAESFSKEDMSTVPNLLDEDKNKDKFTPVKLDIRQTSLLSNIGITEEDLQLFSMDEKGDISIIPGGEEKYLIIMTKYVQFMSKQKNYLPRLNKLIDKKIGNTDFKLELADNSGKSLVAGKMEKNTGDSTEGQTFNILEKDKKGNYIKGDRSIVIGSNRDPNSNKYNGVTDIGLLKNNGGKAYDEERVIDTILPTFLKAITRG